MFLAEIMRVVEEGNAELRGGVGVVRARVGEDGVALADEGFGEKLGDVAEPNNGDFEACGCFDMGLQLGSKVVV